MTLPTVTDVFVITGALPQPDGSAPAGGAGAPAGRRCRPAFTGAADGFTPRIGGLRLRRAAGRRGDRATTSCPRTDPRSTSVGAQRRLLAGVTGHSEDSLRTTSVLEATVPARRRTPTSSAPTPTSSAPADSGVTVVTTFTPDGGRVRTSRLVGSDRGGRRGPTSSSWPPCPPPTRTPCCSCPPAAPPASSRSRPTAPPRSCVTQDGQVRASATIHQGLATLCDLERTPWAPTFRLRVLAPDGHVVYDAVPRRELRGARLLTRTGRPLPRRAGRGTGALARRRIWRPAARGVALWREPAAHRPVLA